jgi:DNA-binding response OmpR family regulator
MPIGEEGLRGACVAIAEGDAEWRRSLRGVLDRAGYDVVEYATISAIPASAQPKPSLLLVDVAPPKTFHDAVASVRAARAAMQDSVPVAVIGPQRASQLSILARACEAVGWVERSDEPATAVRAVRKLLANKSPRPELSEWTSITPRRGRKQASDPSWAIIKLLLIDDSEIALALMQEQLQRAGFDVRIALALSEMDSILRGWSPNVILVDVHMPEMRGDKVCTRLKAQVGPDVLVVLCSNMPAPELSAVAEAAGADGFVSKSEGLGEFADRVAAWCRRLSDPIVSIQ